MILRPCIVAAFLAAAAVAQPARMPSPDDILQNLERTFGGVQDLTVTIDGDVALENLRVPRMTATMYFRRPDQVRFVSSTFSIVPREGMSPNPERWRRDYDATLIGRDTVGGRIAWKLQLAAKDPATRLRQAYLWVDASEWTLVRLATMPYGGRTITFEFTYERVGGRYLLPSRLTALFGSVGGTPEPLFKVPEGAPHPAPQVEELQRSLRAGSVTFTYRDHRVNSGLPDSLFISP